MDRTEIAAHIVAHIRGSATVRATLPSDQLVAEALQDADALIAAAGDTGTPTARRANPRGKKPAEGGSE